VTVVRVFRPVRCGPAFFFPGIVRRGATSRSWSSRSGAVNPANTMFHIRIHLSVTYVSLPPVFGARPATISLQPGHAIGEKALFPPEADVDRPADKGIGGEPVRIRGNGLEIGFELRP